jgi:exodeoxyribonuclease V alpha subunit
MSDFTQVHERFANILLRSCCETRVHAEDRTQLNALLVRLSESAAAGSSCLHLSNDLQILLRRLGQDLPWLALGSDKNDKNSIVLLKGPHLYMNKFFHAERDIEEGLKALASCEHSIEDAKIRDKISPLEYMSDEVSNVILNTLKQNLSVITGGPGTGKTTIVVRVLALLIEHYRIQKKPVPRIEVLAPTGKAAARVKESIVKQKGWWLEDLRGFEEADIKAVPTSTQTVQKFLGINPTTRKSRYQNGKKANVDIVIVDEGSMLDVILVKELLAALRPETRLILLGDPYQLASVETGNVLAQIVSQSTKKEWLNNCCKKLTVSHRFEPDSGIAQLADATNEGKIDDVLNLLPSGDKTVRAGAIANAHSEAIKGYESYKKSILDAQQLKLAELDNGQIKAIFDAFESWQVFSPFRSGKYGVDGLNFKIEESLGLGKEGDWYFGKPVMVTANDHSLKLYNGDIGLCLDNEGKTVCFPPTGDEAVGDDGAKSNYRFIGTRILPEHQLVYAMTVHKSQGSEYEKCLLVVPEPSDNQKNLLTREIFYTAITRAIKAFCLFAGESEIRMMVENKTERMSGLLK